MKNFCKVLIESSTNLDLGDFRENFRDLFGTKLGVQKSQARNPGNPEMIKNRQDRVLIFKTPWCSR